MASSSARRSGKGTLFASVGMSVLLIAHAISEGVPGVHRVSLENAKRVREMISKTWDFSRCASDCTLLLGDKVLNTRNLRLSPLEAARLVAILHSETLEDRMYVWGKIAQSAARWIKENGRNVTEFSVEELDKVEGDIVVSRDEVDQVLYKYGAADRASASRNRTKRKAVASKQQLWMGRVRYQLPLNTFSAGEISLIKRAIKHWEDNTCVRFTQASARQRLSGPHIKFVKKSGCWSFIGQQGRGQELSLGNTCFRMGVIAHEIGHSLGLYHEQSRPDQDKYIRINYGNINGNRAINFSAKKWTSVQTLNVPYDYASALHYGAFDFTKNGQPTISPRDPRMQQVLGQREKMSFYDFKIVNLLYCSEKCGRKSLEWSYCQNGGYRDPNNCKQCKCPTGFVPPSCASVAPGVNANCGLRNRLATDQERTLTSPGYPNGYEKDVDCAWRIRAPANHRIRLQFKGQFYIQETRPSCLAYVEVRYKDVTRVGPRFCRSRPPKDVMLSHGQEALILFHTKKRGYRGFSLSYKAERCGGCSSGAEETEPVAYRLEKYDCSVEVNAICDNRPCKTKRENTCFREESYCCDGYNKVGDRRRRVARSSAALTTTTTPPPDFTWGPWSEWSPCSASCGLCGSSVRQRNCLRGNCRGAHTETRRCPNGACPDTPPIRIRRMCDRFGNVCPVRSNCVGAQICFQEMPPLRCCAGTYILNDCVL